MTVKTDSKPISAFTLFTKSKELVLKNYEVFGLLFLLPFLAGLFANIRSRNISTFERATSTGPDVGFSGTLWGIGGLIGLAAAIVYVLVTIAMYVLTLESAKGKKPTLKELWPYVQKYGVRLFFLSIVVGLVIVLGFVALIVPGLIFLRRYYLAPYVMIDQDLSVRESMKESARLSKPYSSSIWTIFGVSILLSLPGIVPVVGWIISFVLTSLYAVAPALRYFELKKLSK